MKYEQLFEEVLREALKDTPHENRESNYVNAAKSGDHDYLFRNYTLTYT